MISGCCLKWCVWCCPKWCGCPQYWDTRSIIQCLISCSFNHLDLALKPSLNRKISKVTFPNLPPAQGYASPSRKLVLPQINHNYTVGVIYVYIWIDCQSSILSHMVPELIKNLIWWNCKGCIGKSIGPVKYRFTIFSLPPSLRAQRLVAGSFFLESKKRKKTTRTNWANYMPLSQLGVPSSPRPIHIMDSLLAPIFVCQLTVT